jgi:hypothetical protein
MSILRPLMHIKTISNRSDYKKRSLSADQKLLITFEGQQDEDLSIVHLSGWLVV